mgnify:CR=1 FL=1
MIRRPPRSTLDRSSAASDVYKRQEVIDDFRVRYNFAIMLEHHAPKGSGGSGFREMNPVSYTHLRAHETVLDIVCRLLLENKKYLVN